MSAARPHAIPNDAFVLKEGNSSGIKRAAKGFLDGSCVPPCVNPAVHLALPGKYLSKAGLRKDSSTEVLERGSLIARCAHSSCTPGRFLTRSRTSLFVPSPECPRQGVDGERGFGGLPFSNLDCCSLSAPFRLVSSRGCTRNTKDLLPQEFLQKACQFRSMPGIPSSFRSQ